MIHATKKSMKELGDQVHGDEKTNIEHTIAALKPRTLGL
jgi:molecular chaperone DnaK